MPNIRSAHFMGRAVLAGMITLTAGAAMAAGSEVVVTPNPGDMRAISVPYSDLDMNRAYDRETLSIRINNASRAVCDVADGSKLDNGANARSCVDQARAGAMAQLEARGVTAHGSLAGGMR